MKIVTWNCNGAFRKKYHAIENFQADILVIQECEDPARSTKEYQDYAGDYLWKGDNKNKGIGVFSKGDLEVKDLNWNDDGLESFLSCRIGDMFNFVAVWTKYANSPNFRYIGQLWKYLQLHKEQFSEGDLVLCGDLNSNMQWDQWDRWWNHSDVVRELKELNIHSLYHRIMNEEQGKESKPTLFMHRKLERPYHIDYAFLSESLFSDNRNTLEVGDPDTWLDYSDHMPIVFTIAY